MFKTKNGITLIALIITIMVLLILAGETIALVINKDGIFQRAREASDKYTELANKENDNINNAVAHMEKYNKLGVLSDREDTIDELKRILIDTIYPVGSIYITTNDINPSETLGGEWEKYSQGRTLIGDGTDNDGDINGEKIAFTAGNKGGEYRHTLTVSEMPSHQHQLPLVGNSVNDGTNGAGFFNFIYGKGQTAQTIGQKTELYITDNAKDAEGNEYSFRTSFTGGNNNVSGTNTTVQNNSATNNIQPYVVTYIWKRTK